MSDTSTWLERLLWATVGVGFAVAGFFALGLRFSVSGDGGSPSRGAPASPVDRAVPGGSSTWEPECFVGVVLARETVDVVSEIDGTLESINVEVGDPVARGQRLAVVDSEALRHSLAIERANLANVRAKRRRTELALDRASQEFQRRLALEGILSEEQTEASRFERETAQAELEIVDAEIEQVTARIRQLRSTLAKAEVRSPFEGTIALRYVDVGTKVVPGEAVLRLISSKKPFARFAMPPARASEVQVGSALRIELENLETVLEGAAVHLAPEIDPVSQMLFVEASLTLVEGVAVPTGTLARVSLLRSEEEPGRCWERPQAGSGGSSTRGEGTLSGAARRSSP